MKSKKIISAVITASLLTLPTTTALGAGLDISASQNTVVSASVEEVQQSNFKSFKGTVKSITETEKGNKVIVVEDSQGEESHFIINEKTYFINDKAIEEGVTITGYYDATRPMIMIYPPQYVIDVAMVGDMKETVKVDLFDNNLVSVDNQLKIRVDKDTEIISQDGTRYSGQLENKNLVVMYDIATKSIPAQTKPIKVIVLDKEGTTYENDVKEGSNIKGNEIIKLINQVLKSLTVNK